MNVRDSNMQFDYMALPSIISDVPQEFTITAPLPNKDKSYAIPNYFFIYPSQDMKTCCGYNCYHNCETCNGTLYEKKQSAQSHIKYSALAYDFVMQTAYVCECLSFKCDSNATKCFSFLHYSDEDNFCYQLLKAPLRVAAACCYIVGGCARCATQTLFCSLGTAVAGVGFTLGGGKELVQTLLSPPRQSMLDQVISGDYIEKLITEENLSQLMSLSEEQSDYMKLIACSEKHRGVRILSLAMRSQDFSGLKKRIQFVSQLLRYGVPISGVQLTDRFSIPILELILSPHRYTTRLLQTILDEKFNPLLKYQNYNPTTDILNFKFENIWYKGQILIFIYMCYKYKLIDKVEALWSASQIIKYSKNINDLRNTLFLITNDNDRWFQSPLYNLDLFPLHKEALHYVGSINYEHVVLETATQCLNEIGHPLGGIPQLMDIIGGYTGSYCSLFNSKHKVNPVPDEKKEEPTLRPKPIKINRRQGTPATLFSLTSDGYRTSFDSRERRNIEYKYHRHSGYKAVNLVRQG